MSDGMIEQDGQQVRFRYERELRHPVERVWAAITDPAEIERWFGGRPEIDLRPGGEYVSVHGNGVRVTDRVLTVEPPTLFEHTFWVELNPTARVTWQLRPTEDGCVLTLTHTMSEEDIRSAAATGHPVVVLSRNAAGWHRLLDEIECHLDHRTRTWTADDEAALQQHYETALRREPQVSD